MDQNDGKEHVDSLIDQNLKRVYEDILNEEVPDRFEKLLAQLKAGEAPPSDADGGTDG